MHASVVSLTTDSAYDNLGRKVSETAPAPATGVARPVTRFAYDAIGNKMSETDPLGNITAYAYDALDRRTTMTDARGFSTVTAYDLVGNITKVIDASGNATLYAYDRGNLLIREVDALSNITSHAFDRAGNKVREIDRLGRVTTFVYDAADRLVEERWQASLSAPVSHTIRRVYDAASQLLGVTETDTVNPAATTAWQFSYDALGNVIKSRMAPGEIVQSPATTGSPSPPGSLAAGDATIDWDNDGQAERYDVYPITLVVGDQLLLTASSSAFDPVLLLQRPGQGLATAFFDDHSGGGTAARLLVTADIAGTWGIAVTARDENAAGSYDLQVVQDRNAIVPTALVEYDFVYDKAGNVTVITEDQAAVADMYGFGKAASGLGMRTAQLVNALNQVTLYRQIDTVTGAVTKRVDYAYRADGSVSQVTRFAGAAGANRIGTSTAGYDGMGRLTGITHAPSASASIAYAYAYDAASRMTSMTSPEGTSSFMLDATDQLLSASLTGEAYAYDKTGNRTSSGTQTSTGNRLLFDGTYRYAYDAEGNRTAKFIDTDGSGALSAGDTDVTAYGYDYRNRLVAVSHVNAWTATQAAGLPGLTASGTALPGSDLELRYSYDYADRRISRMIDADGIAGAGQESVSFAGYAGDVRTLEIARPNDKLVIDGTGRVIGFLGQVVQRNFYGNGVDEILAVDQISWNGSTPMTSTFWMFTDHQDSVRDIVSGNAADRGAVVEHRQYDSFGKIVKRVAGPQTGAPVTAGVGIDFGYAGRPLEARSGLSDNSARWYEPGTGRFINEDPSGFKGGDANLYRYVGNDPLDQVDPSGLAAKWAQQAARQSVPEGGWGALVQQNATLPKAASPSVSAMAYASLVRQPAQAPAGPIFSSMPAMTATVSGTRPIVTPVSQSVSGQAYSGLSAGGEPTFAQGFATGLAKGGVAVGLGYAAGVGLTTVASPAVLTGAAIAGVAYGSYSLGRTIYQASTGNETNFWTGNATGRTFTAPQRAEMWGEAAVGVAAIGAGAAKVTVGRGPQPYSGVANATANRGSSPLLRASVPQTSAQRSLSARIKDFQANPQNWQRTSASAEQATSRSARGGVSVESVYRNPVTGETIHVHDVFKPAGTQIPNHPTFRDFGKGQ